MTKRIAIIAGAVLTTALAVVLLWEFRLVFAYVLISLMLAAALRPLVIRLAGKKIIFKILWILLYVSVFAGFGYGIFLVSQGAVSEIEVFSETVSAQDAWTLPVWLQGTTFNNLLMTQLPPPSKLVEAFTGDQGQLIFPTLLTGLQNAGTVISGMLIILFLSVYWSINQVHFERLWLSLLPSDQRKQARNIWRTIEPETGSYIRGQVIQSILAGLILGLGYWLLGSPYPMLLGLAGALACLIPVVGFALVLIPVLLVGLVSNLFLALVTTLFAFGVLIALQLWIRPRLFKRNWDNPILTVVLLIALADAFGIIGIVVAPPLSVVCQILWNSLVSHRTTIGAAAQISDLQDRQNQLLQTIQAMDEPALPLVTSSMERLAQLLEKAGPILHSPAVPEEPLSLHPPLPKSDE